MNTFRTLYREPLVHFLVLAIALFLLHSAVSHDDDIGDGKRIVVDEASLLTFIQYRSKSFEPVAAKRQLESFTDEELQRLIDDYVREEALYREARALGLGRDDYVIKRRLIQKVEYIARGFAESLDEVSEEDIEKYFSENQQYYYIDPRITFTHVYYGFERHGNDGAIRLAEEKLAELQRAKAGFNDASRHGERFLYGLNYVERSKLYVESHFGKDLTEKVFAIEPNDQGWHGPILSEHGAHVVMVARKEPGHMPTLAEARARVESEARRAIVAERAREATEQIVAGYRVDLVYQPAGEEVASVHKDRRR
jgi:hypothetical protein